MAQRELLAGWASEDITPEPGIPMGGYWGRKSGATGVHDRLKAKALAFADGEGQAALVALDLVGLDAATVRQVRDRVRERTGIRGDHLMVCCSHTHSGPLTVPFRGMGEADEGYLARLRDTVVRLVEEAAGSRRPARLVYGKVPARVGINRREVRRPGETVLGENPVGPAAGYAHVLGVEAEGGRAVLFSHACHAVVLGSDNHLISGDFAGAAARHVEAQTGGVALFVNGACGDINPQVRGGFGQVEQVGHELGEAVTAGLRQATPLTGATVRGAGEQLALPLIDPPPVARMEVEKLVLQLKAEIARISDSGGDAWAQMVPRARLSWAQDMLALSRAGATNGTQPFEIQVLRVGPLAFLGLEGEIFVRYQLELEAASPLQPTILCGYANGCIGYVPTADEYPRGGYEVTEAYKVYPGVQMIGPQTEGMIRERAGALLARLAAE